MKKIWYQRLTKKGHANPDNILKLHKGHKICCPDGNEPCEFEVELSNTGTIEKITVDGEELTLKTPIDLSSATTREIQESVFYTIKEQTNYVSGGVLVEETDNGFNVKLMGTFESLSLGSNAFAKECNVIDVCDFPVVYKPGTGTATISFDGGVTTSNIPTHTFGTTTVAQVKTDLEGLVPSGSKIKVSSVVEDTAAGVYTVEFYGPSDSLITITSDIGARTGTCCDPRVEYVA